MTCSLLIEIPTLAAIANNHKDSKRKNASLKSSKVNWISMIDNFSLVHQKVLKIILFMLPLLYKKVIG